MRHETLLKIIIGVFAIMLIVLATFVYGNVQRSKQKANNTNTQSTPSPNQTAVDNDKPATPSNNTTPPVTAPSTQPTTPPVATATPQSTNIPATGASDAVLPMTVLAILSFALYNRKQVVYSKSQLR